MALFQPRLAGREEKQSGLVRTCPRQWRVQKGRDMAQTWGFSLGGVKGLSHVLGNLANGSNPEKTTPLAGLETTGAYRRAPGLGP